MVLERSRKKSLMDIKKNNIDTVQLNKYILPIQKSMLFYFPLVIIIILEIIFIY